MKHKWKKNSKFTRWRVVMKRVIICEGPDNCGKTTLCELLKQEFAEMQPTVVHCGPPQTNDPLKFQVSYLKTTIRSFEENSGLEIWDRSVIGECVYGPLYRQNEYDHETYERNLMHEMQTVESRIFSIVMYTNGGVYKQMNIKAKKDEEKLYQKMVQAPKIAIRFVDVFTKLGLKHTLYINCENYESFDIRNRYIMKRVRAWLHHKPYEHLMTNDFTHTFFNNGQMMWKRGIGFMKWRYECSTYDDKECALGCNHAIKSEFGRAVNRPTGACGAIDTAKYIFVGEAPGHDGCGKLGIPFYDDRSGNLMQTTLDRLGIHPTHYYMTNIVHCTPERNDLLKYVDNQTRRSLECVTALKAELLRIIDKNPTVKIIALGKVAGYELSRFGMEHSTVYHPAYYLRMGISDEFHRALKMVMEEA